LFLADQLIMKVRPGVSMTELRARLDGLRSEFMAFIAPGVCTVRLRESDLDSVPRALAGAAANADVIDYAEGDGVGFGGAIPNDPNFGEQWGANNTGQSGGTAGADVDAPEMWDILGSTPGLVIAVLDSGLNFTHPDLLGLAWTNSLEIPGDGIDNDGDGFIDDVAGWDFTNNDNDPTDDHGHGSNVSGIIAANRNNGVGVAGMLAGAKILVCKILNSANAGTTSALISATTYARLRGVPVMNMSLQNYPFSSTLNTEFNACQTAGILLSICAGNQGVNNDVTFNYPSCYQHTNIIAVGNHDRTDVRWSGSFNPSNYGPTNVDLFAPGRDILSPVLGTSYAYYTGTSQATPYVTALAAAIKYLNPTWKAPEIKASIMASVVTRPAYAGICVTGGRFNALNSVSSAVRQQTTNDVDGDRVSNLMEYLAGTRIDDSTSRPATTFAIQSGALRLKMPRLARPDAHLEIQRSTNLVDWSSAGVVDYSTANLLDGGVLVGAQPAEFLRVKASPTP
jgi:subtilisin family serine protease